MVSNMEFNCKLANEKEIKKISDFNSIYELYKKVSSTFSIETDDILYCTLNTDDARDMNSLLGNYLSQGDLIVAHLCGEKREIKVNKSDEYLGLTITDNGNGRAFVKKLNTDNQTINDSIEPGDHLAEINYKSTIGCRHYEVAKALREIQQNTNFQLVIVKPSTIRNKDEFNSSYSNQISPGFSLMSPQPIDYREKFLSVDTNYKDSFKGTENSQISSKNGPMRSPLPIDRLLSKSCRDQNLCAGFEFNDSHYTQTIEKINAILESFMGINDNTLAIQIYRLATENKDSYDLFDDAVKASELAIFDFCDDIKANLWNSAVNLYVQ